MRKIKNRIKNPDTKTIRIANAVKRAYFTFRAFRPELFLN